MCLFTGSTDVNLHIFTFLALFAAFHFDELMSRSRVAGIAIDRSGLNFSGRRNLSGMRIEFR
jgi:hypothetical protein